MIIDNDNYEIANDAARDILFMFRDMIESYRGFGHAIDCGSFDPFAFIDVEVHELPGCSLTLDEHLLRSGAAISLLCALSDSWDETSEAPPSRFVARIRSVLATSALSDLPELRAAIELGCTDWASMREAFPGLYATYVRGYFEQLLRDDSA